jgi:hypothetical protein
MGIREVDLPSAPIVDWLRGVLDDDGVKVSPSSLAGQMADVMPVTLNDGTTKLLPQWIAALLASAGLGIRGYTSVATMNADGGAPEGAAAIVISDPNPVFNYPRTAFLRTGGIWVQGADGFAEMLARIANAETTVGALSTQIPAKLGRTEITAASELPEGAQGQFVVVWDRNDSTFKLLDITQIGDDMAQVHWFDASDTFGTSRTVLVQDDGTLRSLRIQNNSDSANVAIGLRGAPAAIKSAGSITLGPGKVYSEDKVPAGNVTIVAEADGTSVTCLFGNLSGQNPSAMQKANALIARFPVQPSEAWKQAIRVLYADLYNAGIIVPAAALWVPAAPDLETAKLNWATPDVGLTFVNSPTWTKGVGLTMNGTTHYATTGLRLRDSDKVSITNISMFVGVGSDGSNGTNRPAVGDGTTEIVPNRTSNSFGTRSGAASGETITGSALGGTFGLSRTNTETYVASYNDTLEVDATHTTNTTFSLNDVLLGVRSGSGGPTAATYYSGTIKWAYVGPALASSQKNKLHTSFATFLTTVNGLA